MTKLAESSGTVLHESGNKLYISKRPAEWTSTFLFVTGLLALIVWVNGLVQFFVIEKKDTESSSLGTILIAIAVVVSIVFWRVWMYRKKVRAIPPNELKNTLTFDFETNNLLDDQQNILTPLSQARLIRKMQLTSSSPELIISWDRGSLSIAKGNPFSGGIAKIENVLVSKGIRKK